LILYNLTCHIERSIDPTFKVWVKDYFLPQLLATNFLEDAFLLKLLTEIDDQTNTYSIQIKFKSIVYYQQFQLEIEENILNEIQGKFIGKIFTFSTLLEAV
jgi:hypothetical protein